MKIDYDELQMAMSFNDPIGVGQFYLDTQTGEVLPLGDWVEDQARQFDDPAAIEDEAIRLAWYLLWHDNEVSPEMPEADEKVMTQQVDTYLERFIRVPEAPSHEGYRDMELFVDTVANPRLRNLLQDALNGRKPFRCFKDVLGTYPNERERWFAFSAQRWQSRIDAWLQDEGVVAND